MALPSDVNHVTVTGTFLDFRGNPLTGAVTFEPSFPSVLISRAFRRIIGRANYVAELDGTGSFSISLPCTDDTDLIPTGFTYRVTEPPGAGRTYSIVVPVATPGGTLDLYSVVPSGTANPGTVQLLQGPKGDPGTPGAPGGVVSLNGRTGTLTGFVEQAALNTALAGKVDVKLPLSVRDFGVLGDGTDESTKFLQAIQIAAGRELYLPAGDYRVSITLTDEPVHLTGPGRLLHQQGKSVLTVKRTLGAAQAVASIASVQHGATSTADLTETNTAITLTGSAATLRGGDLLLLASDDVYPFAAGLSTFKGYTCNVWQSGFVQVIGIGLTAAITGTVAGGDTIVGASSGATARVRTINPSSGTDMVIVFDTIDRDFTAGETLTVNGTAVGTATAKPYLIAPGTLLDTYATNPVVRKVPTTAKFIFDGPRIGALGDTDALVGTANRKPAVLLQGVYRPWVRSTVDNGWTRAWQVLSCWGGQFDVVINKLPNSGESTEQGFGYGVEFAAATEGCTAKVDSTNCRHGFSTNVFWQTTPLDPLLNGNPKWNRCIDSIARGSLHSSYDTHEGVYFQTFENCRSVTPASGNHFASDSIGFVNRGFGTLFKNCIDDGSVVGFFENSYYMDPGFVHIIRVHDCLFDNYQRGGIEMAGDLPANHRLDISDTETRGNGRPSGVPSYQSGVSLKGGRITLRNVTARRFNGCPIRLTSANGRYDIMDCLADYTEAPAGGVSGIRVDAAVAELTVRNYKVRQHPTLTSSPQSIFRVTAGASTVNLDSYSQSGGPAPAPLVLVSAGSLAVNWKNNAAAVHPVAVVGDASVTLNPRSSAPTQVFSTPLTASRTVTLSTATGVPMNGDTFRVVRTAAATGASTLTVAGKALAAGQWADVSYDGAAWTVVASGSL